ncbi:hypothetical protein BH23PAT1_BH23PAT1_4170 [soil metagenome]
MADIQAFRNRIIECGYVLDPEGVHHEFVSGMHGQKLDFDNIDEETDPLYDEWIDVNEGFIRENFTRLPEIIIGVARGTNRLALDTARRFEGEVVGLVSKKDSENSKSLYLPQLAKSIIGALSTELLVVVEDVGTTGSNSVQVATQSREAGAEQVVVVTTWKRRERLERLEEAGMPYLPIIDEPLRTFEPEECRSDPGGFCYRNWQFIPRG